MDIYEYTNTLIWNSLWRLLSSMKIICNSLIDQSMDGIKHLFGLWVVVIVEVDHQLGCHSWITILKC